MMTKPRRAPAKPGPRDYDEAFADNARALLQKFVEATGSQAQASKRLGVAQGRISKVLSKIEQPKLSLLIELRREMQVPLDVILGLPLLLDEEAEARRVTRLLGGASLRKPG